MNLPIGAVGVLILLACLPSFSSKSCPDFISRRVGTSADQLTRNEILGLVWRYFDFAGL
jgi:hypothetical protein